MKSFFATLFSLLLFIGCDSSKKSSSSTSLGDDPLPSWTDNEKKKLIIDYIALITNEDSEGFIPEADRIAVFDNDGTLWSEVPVAEVVYNFNLFKRNFEADPAMQTPANDGIIKRGDADILSITLDDAVQLFSQTKTRTGKEFTADAKEWITTSKHPKTNKLYTEMVYQPMIELLDYLSANGFKNYIVSGGSNVFMRTFATDIYKIPSSQIIGSMSSVKYTENGTDVEVLPNLAVMNDKEVKVESIFQYIGKKPVVAVGNSDGDYNMLNWTSTNSKPNLQVLLHHTDDVREFKYEGNEKGVATGAKNGWIVVDMKNDFKKIFPFE